MNQADIVNDIRSHHRRRRFAMKIQQKLDRALESFVRVNATEWSPDLAEDDREAINKEVRAIIKKIRAGEPHALADVISTSDHARHPADEMRESNEKAMAELATQLPVYPWIEAMRGAGALGLATIVAESGDLSNYPNPAKLWKRLGFAPFDGFAGSTWKRETWRPRALTKDEWIENPFSGERYALMHQIAIWLVNAQWIGKAKTASGEGEPNGPYGQVYADRRARTLQTHADWSDGHRRMDALRIAMKAFLKDLLLQWRAASSVREPEPNAVQAPRETHHVADGARAASVMVKPSTPLPHQNSTVGRKAKREASTSVQSIDRLPPDNSKRSRKAASPAIQSLKPNYGVPGTNPKRSRQSPSANQRSNAAARPAKHGLKPIMSLPGDQLSNGHRKPEPQTRGAVAGATIRPLKPRRYVSRSNSVASNQ